MGRPAFPRHRRWVLISCVAVPAILAGLVDIVARTADPQFSSSRVCNRETPSHRTAPASTPVRVDRGSPLPLPEAIPEKRPVGPQLDLSSWKPILSTSGTAGYSDPRSSWRWRGLGPAPQFCTQRSIQVLFCTWVV